MLAAPGLFKDPGGVLPSLSFHDPCEFQFPSAILTPWAENNCVRGKLFRAGPDWRGKPSVILLHGWSAEFQYRWQLPYLAGRLARAGVNAALFELPYHGRRRPRAPGAIHDFISQDLFHMIEATRQAISDARSLLAWLSAQGSPAVGFWGISLGAWLAGLVLCTDPGARFSVLLTPVADLPRAIAELAFCRPIRASLGNSKVSLEPLNLGAQLPLASPRDILLVESRYDVFAPVETIEQLWRAWGKPEIWRLRHGHISVLLSPRIMHRIVAWLRHKAFSLASFTPSRS